jgi:TolB protein
MTVEGLSNTKLTTQTPSNQIQPSWSYDGTKIAYASNAEQTPSATTWEIWTMNADGSNQQALTSQTPSWAIAPAYSPVSDDLLFVSDMSNTAGGTAIWKWNGTTVTQLYPATTTHADHYGDASVAIAGFAPTLALPAGAGISKPAWSLDGTKIAFSTDKDGGVINIYVMNADGSGVQTLEAYVNSLLASPVTAGSITSVDDECCPYWLEDGSGLAFAKEAGGVINLYKVSFSNGSVTKLTETGNNVTPAARR